MPVSLETPRRITAPRWTSSALTLSTPPSSLTDIVRESHGAQLDSEMIELSSPPGLPTTLPYDVGSLLKAFSSGFARKKSMAFDAGFLVLGADGAEITDQFVEHDWQSTSPSISPMPHTAQAILLDALPLAGGGVLTEDTVSPQCAKAQLALSQACFGTDADPSCWVAAAKAAARAANKTNVDFRASRKHLFQKATLTPSTRQTDPELSWASVVRAH